MTPDEFWTQFVEDMTLDVLCFWADILNVEYDQWLDDEWPDREDDLRVAVAEAMGKVGAK